MSEIPELEIRPFKPSDQDDVIRLWQATGLTRPWNDPAKDISRKMKVQPELFIVGIVANEQEQLVATAMCGYDGHRGWVNYLAVAPDAQGRGYGRQIMAHLEAELLALGCPKLNLQVRAENTAALTFYEAAGYKVDAAVSLGKRLIPDD